jgi:enoyl-CoA hydratase/carnithine racemase
MTPLRETLEDEILTITLDRPHVLNALSYDLLVALDEALAAAEAPSVRVVVLAGEGGSFCSGADVGEILGELDIDRARVLLEALARVLRRIGALPKPVVAAIHGHTAGGGLELAIEADVRVAADDVQLWLPDVGVGSTPTTVWHLTRLVGRGVATEMAMLGRRLGAAELERFGVVHEVVPRDGLAAAAAGIAARLRDDASARSLRHAKAAVRLADEVDRDTDLRMNIELMLDCYRGGEQHAAVARFGAGSR